MIEYCRFYGMGGNGEQSDTSAKYWENTGPSGMGKGWRGGEGRKGFKGLRVANAKRKR